MSSEEAAATADREEAIFTPTPGNHRVLKYTISNLSSPQTDVLMREGAVICVLGMEAGEVCAWADTPVGGDPQTVTRTFRVMPTGSDVPDPGTYLGTVFGPTKNGRHFVGHVYEVTA